MLCTTSDLADIVRIVGGTAVSVDCLCKGPEDPHFLDARPSFIGMAHRAELLVITGMELEVGYLPLMLRDGANPRIQPGTPGYLDASTRIKKMQVPSGGVSRAQGDVHPGGNPHYLLDPAASVVVADDVARALSVLRPDEAAGFAQRAKDYRGQVSDLMLGTPSGEGGKGPRTGGMLERFKPYKGAGVYAFHENLVYLATRLGLDVVDTLEPKPGVPPTASHIAELIERGRNGAVKAVVYNVFQPTGPVETVASAIGAKAVLLAHQPGATPDAPDLLTMYRRNADAAVPGARGLEGGSLSPGGPSPAPVVLSARGLCARAGGRVLFEGLDLDLHRGEIVALTGPNGAGKSTLLRLLLGLARPSAGSVVRTKGVRVGYVPQLDPADEGLPFPAATVVAQGLTRGRRDRGFESRFAVATALAEAGFRAPHARRYPRLSGGERRRVLLARALVAAPDLLVLDEPTAGVDPEGERQVVALVHTQAEQRGAAVLWVCHGLAAVEASADRMLRLGASA